MQIQKHLPFCKLNLRTADSFKMQGSRVYYALHQVRHYLTELLKIIVWALMCGSRKFWQGGSYSDIFFIIFFGGSEAPTPKASNYWNGVSLAGR